MEVRFHLKLSAEKYRQYYAGNVQAVQVVSHDGRRIRFPANVLQPYLTHDGIEGEFIICFDDSYRLVSIEKIS